MKERYYGIKNHKIMSNIDVAPFSIKHMDEWAKKCGYDGWIELDKKGALILMQLYEGEN